MAARTYYEVGQSQEGFATSFARGEQRVLDQRAEEEKQRVKREKVAQEDRRIDLGERREKRLLEGTREEDQLNLIGESVNGLLQTPIEQRQEKYDKEIAPIIGQGDPLPLDDKSLMSVLADTVKRYDSITGGGSKALARTARTPRTRNTVGGGYNVGQTQEGFASAYGRGEDQVLAEESRQQKAMVEEDKLRQKDKAHALRVRREDRLSGKLKASTGVIDDGAIDDGVIDLGEQPEEKGFYDEYIAPVFDSVFGDTPEGEASAAEIVAPTVPQQTEVEGMPWLPEQTREEHIAQWTEEHTAEAIARGSRPLEGTALTLAQWTQGSIYDVKKAAKDAYAASKEYVSDVGAAIEELTPDEIWESTKGTGRTIKKGGLAGLAASPSALHAMGQSFIGSNIEGFIPRIAKHFVEDPDVIAELEAAATEKAKPFFEAAKKSRIKSASEMEGLTVGEKWVADYTLAATKMSPVLASAVIKGVTAMPVLYEQVWGEAYDNARDTGRTIEEAQQDASVYASLEILTETPVFKMAFKVGGKAFVTLLKTSLGEGAGEFTNSMLGDAYDRGFVTDDMSVSDSLIATFGSVESWKNGIYDASIGVGLGATIGGVGLASNKAKSLLRKDEIEPTQEVTVDEVSQAKPEVKVDITPAEEAPVADEVTEVDKRAAEVEDIVEFDLESQQEGKTMTFEDIQQGVMEERTAEQVESVIETMVSEPRPRKPDSLLNTVMKNGGVELNKESSMVLVDAPKKLLVEGGMTPHRLSEVLSEAGYDVNIGDDTGAMNALRDEINGTKRSYSPDNAEAGAKFEAYEQLLGELDQLGIPYQEKIKVARRKVAEAKRKAEVTPAVTSEVSVLETTKKVNRVRDLLDGYLKVDKDFIAEMEKGVESNDTVTDSLTRELDLQIKSIAKETGLSIDDSVALVNNYEGSKLETIKGLEKEYAVKAPKKPQQTVIEGAEEISGKELAERRMRGKKEARVAQQPADDGLFDVGGRSQTDIFAKPKKAQPPKSKKAEAMKGEAMAAPLKATSKNPPHMSSKRIPDAQSVVVGNTALGTSRTVKPPKKPLAQRIVSQKIIKVIGDRLYAKKLRGKAIGMHMPTTGEVISEKKDNIEVIAHEMAHYLDHHSGINFKRHYKTKEIAAVSYTKDADLVHKEGFAEFVRAYMTQDSVAQEIAPNFYKKFDELISKNKKLKKMLMDIQELSHQYYNQGGEAKGQAAIGKDRSITERMHDTAKEFSADMTRQKYIDSFYAFQKIGATVGQNLVSGFRNIKYAASTTKAILENGTVKLVDGKLQRTGKGLNEILAPVARKGKKWEDFSLYAYARRANELSKQGRENLFDADMIEAGLNNGKKHPEFKKVFDEMQGFWDRMMDYYVSMGLVDAEAAKNVRALNNEYIPMNRILEGTKEGVGGTGGNPIKRLTGGSQILKNLEANLYNNVQSGVSAAISNKARVELYKGILSHKDGALFASETQAAIKPINLALEQQADLIKKAMNQVHGDGVISKEEAMDIAEGLDTTFFQFGQEPRLAENGLDTVVIDGKRRYFEIKDPVMMEALQGMYRSNDSFETLGKVKHFISSAITNTPPFWLFNMFRDTTHAAVISKHGFIPFVGTLRGIGEHILGESGIKKSKNYKDWLLGGGAFVTADYTNANEKVSLDKRKALGIEKETSLGRSAEFVKGLYLGLGQAIESGTRLEEHRLAIKAGKGVQEGIDAARNISVDFKTTGSNPTLQSYTKLVPFLNASIQGMDLGYRQFAEHKGDVSVKNTIKWNATKKSILKTGGMMAGFSIALWMLNKDDDRFKKLTTDERARHWYMWFGDTEVRIPKPFEIGFMFGTLPELMAEYIFEESDGTDYQKRMLIDGIAHTFLIVEGSNVFGVAQPIVDLWRNKNFLDIPIVSPWELNVQGKANKSQWTSLTAIKLAELSGMKATQIDYLAKGYGGYLASMYNDTADRLLWDTEAWGEAPNFGSAMTNNWFMQRFVGEKVDSRTRYTQEFWLTNNNLREIKDTYDKNRRDAGYDSKGIKERKGDPMAEADYKSFLKAIGGQSGVNIMKKDARDMKKISAKMTATKKEATGIKFDKTLSGKEKAKRIIAIYDKRNQQVKDSFNQIEKRVNMNIKTMKAVQK